MIKLTFTLGGSKFWVLNGGLHRSNGPAVVYSDQTLNWYWYGDRVDEYEHIMLLSQELANGQITYIQIW